MSYICKEKPSIDEMLLPFWFLSTFFFFPSFWLFYKVNLNSMITSII